MTRIVSREKQEYKGGVFYIVTDSDGRIGTAHVYTKFAGKDDRLISRDYHIPMSRKSEAPWASEMQCRFLGDEKGMCDGSGLFWGYEHGDDPVSDEYCFSIAEDMISQFWRGEGSDDPTQAG